MPKINLLTEDLINKIAAGEVIERPASVVKELVENALDAGATRIMVEIKDSGKKLIKVADNGEGMDENDTNNSILRHATSKIKDENDLFSVNTLGFRGEALASIAAVSQLSIVTKQTSGVEGYNLVVEGGKIVSSGIIAAEQGTIMEVHNLFFNTPARKKFLKTDAVELRHIIDIVTRYALMNPKISFKLSHEGHELLHSPAVEDQRSNIAAIYGVRLAKELLEVNYSGESVRISGYIAPPSHARNDRNQQAIFINGRWVRSEDITHAVYDAFHSMLFVNKHPVLVLQLELDPHNIDVNVHPAKTEVKIEQRETIQNAVFTAVKETLQRNNLIPTLGSDAEEQITFGIPQKKEEKEIVKYAFEPSKQTAFYSGAGGSSAVSDLFSGLSSNASVAPGEVGTGSVESNFGLDSVAVELDQPLTTFKTDKFPPLKLLGQIHKTFFVAETEGGIFFIDQHAAHERVLYEEFMTEYENKRVDVQTLLKGDILELSPTEKSALMENKKAIEDFGFQLESFGDSTFVIKTIPSLLGRTQPKDVLYEIITKLQAGRNKLDEIKEEIITRMACRAAVMAGKELTILEMDSILKDLSLKKDPYTCPHGRPVMLKTTAEELEIKFKRK